MIQKSSLQFLKNLSVNNNREWFKVNKDQYEKALGNIEGFVNELIVEMNRHDHIETPSAKKSLYRIYRDVRFSKNKTPYTARFSGRLKRATSMLRGGYYYWIKPGASHVGCGFTYPNPDDLKRIRMDILYNHDDWKRVLNSKSIKTTFDEMRGTQVNTTPRGFSKDDPAIDLLRYKQYWFQHSFSDKEVLADDFVYKMSDAFKSIRPFFDYMSDVLTTDLNGELIVGKS